MLKVFFIFLNRWMPNRFSTVLCLILSACVAHSSQLSFGDISCLAVKVPKTLSEYLIRAFQLTNNDLESLSIETSKFSSWLAKHNKSDFQCQSEKSLQLLNQYVNGRISYGHNVDIAVFNQSDYWQSSSEILTIKSKSTNELIGDCEDFAILKFWLLETLGCQNLNPGIAIVKSRFEDHAVLIFELETEFRVMDLNRDGKTLPLTQTLYALEDHFRLFTNGAKKLYACGKKAK